MQIWDVLDRCLDRLELPSGVELIFDKQSDLPELVANEFQLRDTVLLNVLQNAVESKPKSMIRVRAQAVSLSGQDDVRDGDYLHVCIEDDGEGIAEEHLGQVFDPFFSTKFVGRGLGLSAAQGVLKKHGSCIRLNSVLGEATVCDLFLRLES